ncbi:hypothetical protein, partial [Endozoicomonas sp. SESOKO1]|uniref:hypothetical protein n=1 Tax=Endozoicomonas sp. SESOKO1 TaxID=2828742 RepID=UPI002147F3DE
MDRYNVTTPLNIDPEQIRLAEPKAAKYSGIEAGKATKTLDSHGKLVSHWGRNIKHSFDKTQIYKEKYGEKGSIHTFQKYMTERRVEVLMQKVQEDQEGKNRSNHVDS